MNETYLLLIVGAIAGIFSSIIGGALTFRNLLRTRLMFRESLERERVALHTDISEITEDELNQTEAGKELLESLQILVWKAQDYRENLTISLRRRNLDLLKQNEESKRLLAQSQKKEVAVAASLQESQKTIEKLEKNNKEMDVTDKTQIQNELTLTLQEVARLQNQLSEANMRVLRLEKGPASAHTSELAEIIASISQELREPISSIVGYTDLLLGESVGTLGALQRKFVERINSSTERIGSLIDDLIQITTLKNDVAELKPEVDLNLIIDNAMSYTSSQVREKDISLRLDLPTQMGAIHADREVLQQILVYLLQNASLASPAEGTIELRVQTRTEADEKFVLIQVKDSGGGIPSRDVPHIFTRLYRADQSVIQGVGDTGVGLSIVKTLTEAQNGRIWVETQEGVGSTFNVLIPMTSESGHNKD